MDDDLFGDLDRLRLPPTQAVTQSETKGRKAHRPAKPTRVTGEFLKGPIPLDWLSRAARLPGKAPLAVALAIRFEAGRRRSTEVILTSAILARFGVDRKSKYRGLDALEGAKLIAVLRRPRRNPVVTVLEVENGAAVDEVGQVVPDGDPSDPAFSGNHAPKKETDRV